MHGLGERKSISPWLKAGLTLLATTLVAYFMASSAVLLMVDPVLPIVGAESTNAGKAVAKVSIPPLKFFAPIWQRNPFKAALPKPKAKPKPVADDISKLKVAKVNAALLGTMCSSVAKISRAIVFHNKRQTIMKVGDKLAGFVISDIQRRAIVLKKGNQSQLLLIDDQDRKIAAKKPQTRMMVSRKEIKSKLQDLDALAKEIQLAPATRGKQEGLWVRQLQSRSLFSKVGLQKDDVLLTVGGMKVTKTNPVSLFKLLDQQQVNVNLLRDGKPMQLTLILTGK